ncbi:DUF4124 domain-containing protein [Variovorax sp. LG9.2]|uniref:DUF4124 domain-containing protein n=1 Tax=Variovorax sp. LG9.2 TaxID=3048626 RepID=UPI002B23173F|nr:DUF4124 domain-containing protein [Variovorax sp. LG9.2]MEB0056469.1 DUF4124 domain-containing protein [Variovorax sp. LG9.2]
MAALIAASPAWAVYQCKVDGKTSFQDAPCATGQVQTDVKVIAHAPSDDAPERSGDMATAVDRAILFHVPVKGMTNAELQRTLGNPQSVNTSNGAAGYSEQRVYYTDSRTWYVYTDARGMVTSTQSSDVVRASTAQPVPAQARQCPTLFEIKNEEVSANSITLTDEQRRERQKKIAAMRECR